MSSRLLIAIFVLWVLPPNVHANTTAPSCGDSQSHAADAVASPAFERANAARTAIDAGTLDDVEQSLELALAASQPLGPDHTRMLLHTGRSYARLASATSGDRAQLAGQRAAAIFSEATKLATSNSDERLTSYAQGYLGALYEDHGRLEEAATLTRRALIGADRARAFDALYRWHWQLGRIQRAQGQSARALASYRRAVSQLDLVRGELASASAQTAFAFRLEVEPVYLELVDQLLRKAADTHDKTLQLLLAEARDTLEALKAAELRDHFRDACLDAQRKETPDAVPGAVVLYPVVLPDRVELILSTTAGLSRHVASVSGEALTAEVNRFRRLLTKRTTRQFMPSAQKLYDWLVRPLDGALAGQHIEAFVVVPSGALRTIPFAALYDGTTKQFLIEKVPVATTPGLTLTDPRPIDRGTATSLVAGVSEGVQGFSALQNVSAEMAQVSASFPGVTLLNDEFSAERFEREVRSRPVSIVHIASHGEFSRNADESFILAHDKKIPIAQLASIVGRTRLRTDQPLELLVLSACQTAAGDDQAALGLAGVALRSGARSALATLWSVNDVAAAELMSRFYEELAAGSSRASALQRAQLQLLEKRQTSHPAYWAPFLLISSWL